MNEEKKKGEGTLAMKSYYVARTEASESLGVYSIDEIFRRLKLGEFKEDYVALEFTGGSYKEQIKNSKFKWEPISQLIESQHLIATVALPKAGGLSQKSKSIMHVFIRYTRIVIIGLAVLPAGWGLLMLLFFWSFPSDEGSALSYNWWKLIGEIDSPFPSFGAPSGGWTDMWTAFAMGVASAILGGILFFIARLLRRIDKKYLID